MNSKKILLVVFGTDAIMNKFNDVHENIIEDTNPLEIKKIENLEEQISFILGESEYEDKKSILIRIRDYDSNMIDYILKETQSFRNLKIKFIVLNDNNEENKEDVLKLVDKIEKISTQEPHNISTQEPHNISKDELLQGSIEKYDNINTLYMNLDAINYLIGIIKNSYSSNSLNDKQIPDNISDELKNTFEHLIKKLNKNIKND